MIRQALLYLLLLLVTIAGAAYATAGGPCNVLPGRVVSQSVITSPVVTYSSAHSFAHAAQVFYFVGQPIRAEAVLQYERNRDPDYQQFAEFKRFLEFQRATREESQQKPAQANAQDQGPAKSNNKILSAKCAECHNSKNSGGGFDLSGAVPLDADTKAAVMSSVLSGRMPQNREPLTAQELGELVNSLFLNRW